jgi:hypothetical protein
MLVYQRVRQQYLMMPVDIPLNHMNPPFSMESGKILNGLRKDLTNGDVHWTDGPDIGG